MADPTKRSSQEGIKESSNFLRGDIAAEIADDMPYVSDASYELLKFHGSYQGYDRDTATARKQQGLEKEWEFMLRLKLPGGRLTAAQYLAMDEAVEKYANGTLRITSRETFQFHAIVKKDFKPLVQAVNRALMSTLGGCGDVVRNIITCPAPFKDNIRKVLQETTNLLAVHFAPRAGGAAYYEIWLDGEKVENYPFNPLPAAPDNPEPIYKTHYMPRKFKIAIGQPEDNCMDALTNDLGILALFNGQELHGYNIAVGGGLGIKHNAPKTYARLASSVAFVRPQDMLAAAEAVVSLQRDYGDRADRQHARLKYVVQERGLEWTRQTLEGYLGKKLDVPLPMHFGVEDHMGWHAQGDGKWFLGIPIPSGRIEDNVHGAFRSGLREIIRIYNMPLTLTADQNIILCDIEDNERQPVTDLLRQHNIPLFEDMSLLRRDFLACVALPTCGKALSEAERVAIPLVEEMESLTARFGLQKERLTVRIAGCPNACSRPFVGDIGIVGRTPDHYALYVGGDYEGTRLNEKLFDKVPLKEVPLAYEPLLALYKEKGETGEGFGNFCHRYGLETIKAHALAELSSYAWAK